MPYQPFQYRVVIDDADMTAIASAQTLDLALATAARSAAIRGRAILVVDHNGRVRGRRTPPSTFPGDVPTVSDSQLSLF